MNHENFRSSIETKCILIPELTDTNRNRFAKLVIIEKSPIRYGKDTGTPYQKYIFADAAVSAPSQILTTTRDFQQEPPL